MNNNYYFTVGNLHLSESTCRSFRLSASDESRSTTYIMSCDSNAISKSLEILDEVSCLLEFMPSIKVSWSNQLDKVGVTIKDREYLAEALAHLYLIEGNLLNA